MRACVCGGGGGGVRAGDSVSARVFVFQCVSFSLALYDSVMTKYK